MPDEILSKKKLKRRHTYAPTSAYHCEYGHSLREGNYEFMVPIGEIKKQCLPCATGKDIVRRSPPELTLDPDTDKAQFDGWRFKCEAEDLVISRHAIGCVCRNDAVKFYRGEFRQCMTIIASLKARKAYEIETSDWESTP